MIKMRNVELKILAVFSQTSVIMDHCQKIFSYVFYCRRTNKIITTSYNDIIILLVRLD